jgi:hypothetical protein
MKPGTTTPLYTYEITTYPTEGIYFNLDKGKLWAARFTLDATNGSLSTSTPKGLYLNSHIQNEKFED